MGWFYPTTGRFQHVSTSNWFVEKSTFQSSAFTVTWPVLGEELCEEHTQPIGSMYSIFTYTWLIFYCKCTYIRRYIPYNSAYGQYSNRKQCYQSTFCSRRVSIDLIGPRLTKFHRLASIYAKNSMNPLPTLLLIRLNICSQNWLFGFGSRIQFIAGGSVWLVLVAIICWSSVHVDRIEEPNPPPKKKSVCARIRTGYPCAGVYTHSIMIGDGH